jgi:hypothetical protein
MHEGIWMGGYNPPLDYPFPRAGSRPTGSDLFSAAAEDPDDGNHLFDTYDYWMGMRQDPDTNYWGNQLTNDPNVTTRLDQWICVEHMVKLNNPVTALNGEHAIWMDGTKVSHLGLGFPKGHWVNNRFYQDPSDSTTFEGFRWRNTTNLNLNYIWLQNFTPNSLTELEFDHVVVAKSYIGCLGSGPSDTTAPTISGISASGILSNSATINWATNEAADSQVEYGPTTSYGNSTSLDTSLVTSHAQTFSGFSPLTLYHYRVKSKDAAGNLATSGDYSFTTAAGTPPPTLLMSDNMEGADRWDHPAGCALSTTRNHTAGGSKSMACDASNDNGYANRFNFYQTFTAYTSLWWWAPNGMDLGTGGITNGHGHLMRFFFGNSADDRQLEAYADLWNENAPSQGGPQGWQIDVVGSGGVWAQETFGLSPTFNILDGQWHHIEMFVTVNRDGQSDGVFKVWVDGVLTANFINKKFQANGYSSGMTYPLQITTLQVPSNLGMLADVAYTDDVEWYSSCPSATLYSGTPSCGS